ncbi:sigma-54-dependent Fis family transcriptional regulator [Imbroritus primus]|uniref:Sigma-54-dependent Fis family transcriptional regulator n=1 Tax=Imbroritus primus TaxID=3058603 RepID=A0ACD3STG0_9BURK|nr:sigma-54-dependent Fis family transcriptional regulator [Burkholderiaceae bacterium PBA]
MANRPAVMERILVVDDDVSIGECVEMLLTSAGYECNLYHTGQAGLDCLFQKDFDLVITDLKLPDLSGLDIIAAVKQKDREIPVILMTSFSSVETAIQALRRGANDYIIKPFDNDDFMFSVRRALSERRTHRENAVLKRSLKKVFTKNQIIGESDAVQRLRTVIQRVAHTDANVLIQGESGTGKELVAQAIHFGGDRADRPFVPVNCGAIPADLVESELFGHAKGAYTGAVSASEGLIREASGGTLFLDEISELPLHVQVKLLRVIQERQVRPLGSTQSYVTDTRFLAASNRDLKAEAAAGNFRADLYYRLNVITIQVPPLRERGRDIELLAEHFLRAHSRRTSSRYTMRRDFIEALMAHDWPGNIRELENLIERVVILADSEMLTRDDLAELTLNERRSGPRLERAQKPLSIEEYIKECILLYQDTHSEVELAALLGIGRKALWERRRRWGMTKDGSTQEPV